MIETLKALLAEKAQTLEKNGFGNNNAIEISFADIIRYTLNLDEQNAALQRWNKNQTGSICELVKHLDAIAETVNWRHRSLNPCDYSGLVEAIKKLPQESK